MRCVGIVSCGRSVSGQRIAIGRLRREIASFHNFTL
jgi:hypothetical protein